MDRLPAPHGIAAAPQGVAAAPPQDAEAGKALAWRRLQLSDLDAIEALHRLSIQGLGPEVVKAETREFFISLLSGRGEIHGVFDGDSLVAYGVLQHDLLPQDDPRRHLGLGPDVPVRKLAGAAVHPQWRGQRLQRALVEYRLRRAPAQAVVFATSAPGNPPSWRSLLACGLSVCALESKYGGHPRFLMARMPAPAGATQRPADAPTNGASTNDASTTEVSCTDLATQAGLLAAGWRGVAPGEASAEAPGRQPQSGPTIRYRQVAGSAHPGPAAGEESR